MISLFLLNSEVVERIVFMRKAWLYGVLFREIKDDLIVHVSMFVGLLVYGTLLSEFCVVNLYIPMCPETIYLVDIL